VVLANQRALFRRAVEGGLDARKQRRGLQGVVARERSHVGSCSRGPVRDTVARGHGG
jgi:hypothetical protein